MVFMLGFTYAVQPVRKPFLQIKIDGKPFRTGDIIFVTPGQKLMMEVGLEGGRRDYCKFPDTYADIAGTAQILSRGNDGMTYELNGKKAEWALISENITYSADPFVKVSNIIDASTKKLGEFINENYQSGTSKTELLISTNSFTETFVKITIKSSWQFKQDTKTSTEGNTAEGLIYFKIAGSSDVWYSSTNISATGLKNDALKEKLDLVQNACDSIENKIIMLKFSSLQQAIKNLQTAVNEAKTCIDGIKSTNPSYQTSIVFIGLPSDKPYKNINDLSTIKGSWIDFQSIVEDSKIQLEKLPEKPTTESKDLLIGLIGKCVDWQYHLPENTFDIIPMYIPELSKELIQIPGNIHFIAEEKTVTNYPQTLADFKAFLERRSFALPSEIQKISSTQSKLQAVRLFDGMLRSYFSSINWAEWKNTRE
jgi:hypothetical protein